MAFKTSDDWGPVSEINITPFVDVMLVLLVIFMVATPLMESGIRIELPKVSAKSLPKTDEHPVTLNIDKDARVYLNKEEVGLSDLQNRIIAFFHSRQKKEIFIRADGSLPYSMVAQMMATVKASGISKIGLVTAPPDSSATKTESKSDKGK